MRTANSTDIVARLGITKTAVSTNTTTTGAIIDTQGFDEITFVFGAEVYTDGTFTPLINESDASNMVGETAVADADLYHDGSGAPEASAAITAAGYKTISYKGNKRYVTLDSVSTGVTSGATIASVVILGKPKVGQV